MAKIKGQVTNITKTKLKQILSESLGSIIKFSDYFFPHHKIDGEGNTIPPADMHYEFEELLRGSVGYGRNEGYYNLLGILPRGTAKSTYATVFFNLWAVLFTNKNYIVLVGATTESIKDHFETLKDEVKNNHLLHLVGIRPLEGGKDNDKHFDIIAPKRKGSKYLNDTRIVRISAYSASSFPRGKKRGAQRPDLIIIDDLEVKKKGKMPGVESKAYRDDIEDLVEASIVPSGFNEKSMQIVMLGTIMHEAQKLNQLYLQAQNGTCSPPFKAIKYAMIENYGTPLAKSIWKEKMTVEQFDIMLNSARHKGTESIVYNEYLSMPSSPDDEIFCKKDFKYFILQPGGNIVECYSDGEVIPDLPVTKLRDCSIVITGDLAFTVNERSDFTAFAVSAVDAYENSYLLEIKAGKWESYETITVAKELLDKYKPDVFGIEEAAGGKVMIDIMIKELESNRNFCGVTPLSTQGMKKEDRIINYLQNPYKNGKMFHLFRGDYVSEYEHQLISVTRGGITAKHDDYVDAVSYVYQVTDVGAMLNSTVSQIEYEMPTNNYIM